MLALQTPYPTGVRVKRQVQRLLGGGGRKYWLAEVLGEFRSHPYSGAACRRAHTLREFTRVLHGG